ncbi:hypothetical protein QW131_11275 [Roseibium salinum]|nr:hypothetical protein [Roseibium salinum]
MEFAPKDPDWQARVRASFFPPRNSWPIWGAELVHLAPGAVDLELKLRPEVTQQHGFFSMRAQQPRSPTARPVMRLSACSLPGSAC